MNVLNANIQYNDIIYPSRPASVDEFLSNKYNDVHKLLYIDALTKYLLTLLDTDIFKDFEYNKDSNISKNDQILEFFMINHNVIEIKNDEYWKPSYILIINKVYPYTKQKVDLSKYWNMSEAYRDYKVSDIKIKKDKINDAEVVYYDYVKGIAKMYSRAEDIYFEVPFKYLDENTKASQDLILSNTFTQLYNSI